jgi:16S rRNA (adenine1518-N6/adenine1519-N6)-dimethyltransferase
VKLDPATPQPEDVNPQGAGPRGRRGPFSEYRALLEAVGFHPSRRLGQNFLLDENVVQAIVREAGVTAGELVLEIGAGIGFLTRALLDAGARVVAVEIDRRLHGIVAEELGAHPSLTLVRADVLAGKHQLAPEVACELPQGGEWRVVSNLPYQVSGPVLAVLEALPNPPCSMTVLVQREVAERIVAAAGSEAWGALSARLQAAYGARILRHVPPQLFWPRPKVDSSVVHLEVRRDAPTRAERAALGSLLRSLFPRRRQVLRRVVGDLAGDRQLAEAALLAAGLDPALRVELLEVQQLLTLARELTLRGALSTERSGPGESGGG